MNAFELAWNPAGTHLAGARSNGRIGLYETNAHGGPAARVADILIHRCPVIALGFVGDHLVAADEDGTWSLHDLSGALQATGDLGFTRCTAAIDPTGTLFVLGRAKGAQLVSIHVPSGDTREIPVPKGLTSGTAIECIGPGRVAALTSKRERVDGERRHIESIVHIDADGTSETAPEAMAMQGFSFGRSLMRSLCTAVGTGAIVRPSLDPPPIEDGDGAVLEVDFRKEAGSRKLRIGRLTLEKDPLSKLKRSPPNSEDLHKAIAGLFRVVTQLKLTADGRFLWVAFQGGVVRRVDTETGVGSPLLRPAALPQLDHPSINEIFDRRPTNSPTLAVSPDGRFVAFTNPNQFFSIDEVDLSSDAPTLHLPRAAAPPAETPKTMELVDGAEQLLVQSHGGQYWRVDLAAGSVIDRFHIQWGDCTSASLSPDGALLALGMSGANPRVVDLETGTVSDLVFPPHTGLARFLGPRRLVLTHGDGAVLDADLDGAKFDALRVGYEDEPEPGGGSFSDLLAVCDSERIWGVERTDEEPVFDMDALEIFEQATPVHGSRCCVSNGTAHVTLLKEGGEIERFEVSDGIALKGTFSGADAIWKTLAANRDHIASAETEKGRLVLTDVTSGETTTHEVGPHTRVLSMVADNGPAAWLFRERAGELVRWDPNGSTTVFTHTGGTVSFAALSGRWLVLREEDAPTVVIDLETKRERTLELVVGPEGRELSLGSRPQ